MSFFFVNVLLTSFRKTATGNLTKMTGNLTKMTASLENEY